MKQCRHAGFTLIELLVTVVIVSLLAAAAAPMLEITVQRGHESELRAALRELRTAIDAYKKAADDGRIKKTADQSGYPPNLEVLVEGVPDQRDTHGRKLKFLRRIPRDPMQTDDGPDTAPKWGLRSYDSDPDSPREGEDVFDVYSLSTQRGINGVPYNAW